MSMAFYVSRFNAEFRFDFLRWWTFNSLTESPVLKAELLGRQDDEDSFARDLMDGSQTLACKMQETNSGKDAHAAGSKQ